MEVLFIFFGFVYHNWGLGKIVGGKCHIFLFKCHLRMTTNAVY
jgi:hypothetical protein